MKVTGIMKEGKRHGKWQHWHENGKQQKEAYYLDGKQHGPETMWFEDGQKRLVSGFVGGAIHGLSTEWFKNGQKWSEVHFKQGIAHGPATWWNENGKVSMRLAFRDGKTSYDPASSTVADFDLAFKCMRSIPWDSQNAKLQDVFDRFGKPFSGYSEVANLQTSVDQKWIYRCTDGEAVVRCFLSRNDFNGIGTIANMQTIKKR